MESLKYVYSPGDSIFGFLESVSDIPLGQVGGDRRKDENLHVSEVSIENVFQNFL